MRGALSDVNMNGINQRTRIWCPAPVLLADLQSTSTAFDATQIEFTVPTPDARVQVNVSVYALPEASLPNIPIPFNVSGDDGAGGPMIASKLWLGAWERAGNGLLLPTTDLVGTRSVPQDIPLNTDLMGYSETVLADCDAVRGFLELAGAGGGGEGADAPPPLQWWLKTRYQPVAGCEICCDEWKEIVSKCTPSAPTVLTVVAPL